MESPCLGPTFVTGNESTPPTFGCRFVHPSGRDANTDNGIGFTVGNDDDSPSLDETLELLANLIYLARYSPLDSERRLRYLDLATEVISRERDRRNLGKSWVNRPRWAPVAPIAAQV